MNETLLKVTGLRVKFDHHVLLDKVSFELKRNETLAIIGPNGAGKTTLFRAILNLIPFEGTIEWHKEIKIGYVPQRLSIERDLPLTVLEFFELKEQKFPRSKIEDALQIVGLTHILHHKLGVLSGGELQRILIAWALLGEPDVLLFDEPTAGIDISSEHTIYSLLHDLQKKQNLTLILISHELHIVYKYATSVICLNKETICVGPPREVLDKENLMKLFGQDSGIYHHH